MLTRYSKQLQIRIWDIKPKKQFKLLRPHRLRLIFRELAQLVSIPGSPVKEWMFRCNEDLNQGKRERNAQDAYWTKRKAEVSDKFTSIAKTKFEKVSRMPVKREVVVSVKSSSRAKRMKFEFKPIDKETVDKMVEEEEKRPKLKDSTLHNAMLGLFEKQGVATVEFLKSELKEAGIPHPNFDEVLNEIAIEIPTRKRYVRRRLKGKDSDKRKMQELRCIFIHLFSQSDFIRRKDVADACEQCFGDKKHMSATRYNKLSHEFATSSGSRWCLKTGCEVDLGKVIDLTKSE